MRSAAKYPVALQLCDRLKLQCRNIKPTNKKPRSNRSKCLPKVKNSVARPIVVNHPVIGTRMRLRIHDHPRASTPVVGIWDACQHNARALMRHNLLLAFRMEIYSAYFSSNLVKADVIEAFKACAGNRPNPVIRDEEVFLPSHEYVFSLREVFVAEVWSLGLLR